MPSDALHIVITGASRGIGAAISRVLAQDHFVSLVGRDKEALETVATDLPAAHYRIVCCDITSRGSVQQLLTQLDRVDIFINNAGIAEFGDASTLPYESAERQIRTNMLGPIEIITALIGPMCERKEGMILSVNSVAATTVFSGTSAYSASKAGMLAYTRSMRQDVRSHGVKVVDVIVGATDTEIWSDSSRAEHSHRMLSAGHVAQVVKGIVDTYHDKHSMIEEIIIRPQLGDL